VAYLFLNKYCKVTANLSGTGIVTITGWITMADEHSILMTDEYNNPNHIKREQLIGSIVVLFEQKPEPERQLIEEEGMVCEVGN
jgi:hypothetical protein